MTRERRNSERGHLMVGLMAGVAILLILTLVAEQLWKDVLRRDLEAEMIFRAQDIVRALRRFRTDTGGKLPTELKEMMEPTPRGQYVLRRLWKDPLVKDGKWGLLYLAPQGGLLDPNAPPGTDPTVPGLGGASSSAEKPSMTKPQGEGEEVSPERDERARNVGGATPRQEREAQPSRLGGLGGSWGTGQQQVTGMPIVGVKSLCTGTPFRVMFEQSDYAMWRFTVLDLDQAMQRGAAQGGGAGGLPGQGAPRAPGAGQGSWPGQGKSKLNPTTN